MAENPDPNRIERWAFAVEWVELGEGMAGDYDESDPDDVELLRFDMQAHVDGEWRTLDSGSYCTRLPATAPAEVRGRALSILADHLEPFVMSWLRTRSDDTPWKRSAQQASWIDESCVIPSF